MEDEMEMEMVAAAIYMADPLYKIMGSGAGIIQFLDSDEKTQKACRLRAKFALAGMEEFKKKSTGVVEDL